MRSTDQDGKGRWEYAAVRARYKAQCRRLKIHPREISPDPSFYTTQRGWLSPMMDEIFKGMRAGDRACAWIAIELIEEDAGFAFGATMKAQAARELKRFPLDEKQKQRIRARVAAMLERAFMPHEFQFYARLVAKIGTGPFAEDFARLCAHENRWVRWFARIARGENPGAKPERGPHAG